MLQSALIRPSIRRVSSFARRHSSALPTTCGRLSMGEAHLGVHVVGRASAVLAASPVVGRRARAWRSRSCSEPRLSLSRGSMRVSHPCTQSAWLPFRLRGETAVLEAGVRAALRGGC